MAVDNDLIVKRAEAAVAALDHNARVRAAYLFGSQATGRADEESDIDVAAFVEGAEKMTLRRRIGLGVEVRQKVGDDIEIHLLPAKSLDHPPRASFAAFVIQNGVPIWENHVRDAS